MADSTVPGLASASSVATTDLVPIDQGSGLVSATVSQFMTGGMAASAFTATGSGASARTLQAKLGDTVSIWDFGCAGDGVADDTTPWVNALATGKDVIDPRGGTYKITSALSMATAGQQIKGRRGGTIFAPSGSFDMLTITAAQCGISGVQVSGTNHASGITFKLSGANNCTISGVMANAPRNFFYVQNCNTVLIDDVWAGSCKGSYIVKLYGSGISTGGVRSDLIMLRSFTASADNTVKPIGLDWDGNVASVFLKFVSFLSGCSYSCRIRNTAAGSDPQFGEWLNVQFEYGEYGLLIDTPTYINATSVYVAGASVGDGIKVNNVNAILRMANGIIGSNAGYGINNAAPGLVYATNIDYTSNGSGSTTGAVKTVSPQFEVATNAAFYMTGGNPVLSFDANDYITYDRTNNEVLVIIGGTTVARFNANGLRLPTAPTSASGLSSGQIWNSSNDARIV